MSRGKLISLEGIEGAGKSTLLNYIKEYFTKLNKTIVYTREPGGTPTAENIRKIILQNSQSTENISPYTELLLMFACRSQLMQECIIPNINAGKWVVTDRFIDASYAYQGGGRNLPYAFIEQLDQQIVGDYYPDLTLLLDVDPEVGLARTKNRHQGKDRIEKESLEFFARVRNTYSERARKEPERIRVIDASQPLNYVLEALSTILDEFTTRHE